MLWQGQLMLTNRFLVATQNILLICSFWRNASWRFRLLSQAPLGCHSSYITKWASRISQERFDLQSPNFTQTFRRAPPTTTQDMTSLATSSRKLSGKNISDDFVNFSGTVWSRITKFFLFIRDNMAHKPGGPDVASCFWSAVKCRWVLHRIFESPC